MESAVPVRNDQEDKTKSRSKTESISEIHSYRVDTIKAYVVQCT